MGTAFLVGGTPPPRPNQTQKADARQRNGVSQGNRVPCLELDSNLLVESNLCKGNFGCIYKDAVCGK